jgi:hypothetical protein
MTSCSTGTGMMHGLMGLIVGDGDDEDDEDDSGKCES